MEFSNIDLLEATLYSIDLMDSVVAVYGKKYLMINQGASILVCKFEPDINSKRFNKNFIPYQSLYFHQYFHQEKYKGIFNFFYDNKPKEENKVSETKLVEIFISFNRDFVIDQILND
jgi:hypothetical protein